MADLAVSHSDSLTLSTVRFVQSSFDRRCGKCAEHSSELNLHTRLIIIFLLLILLLKVAIEANKAREEEDGVILLLLNARAPIPR